MREQKSVPRGPKDLAARYWRRRLACARRDIAELERISIALMHERDKSALLDLIISQGKLLTASDGGSVLLLEKAKNEVPRLRLAHYAFDSLPDLPELQMESIPVDNTTIIGHAAVIKRPVVVADAYALPHDASFQRNATFDQRFGYRIRSMLMVPMLDRGDNVLGVLVFINRKSQSDARITSKSAADRFVLPYTWREMKLARSLASQAAVSIENTRLYAQVEQLFESFVKAAASAIDQRDPTTAGHSIRVAALTCDLAAAVERGGCRTYKDVRFTQPQMRELRYAALLHDLGKVAVREEVLRKAKKLPTHLLERVEARFALIRRCLEVEHYRRQLGLSSTAANPRQVSDPAEALDEELAELDRMWSVVLGTNEPSNPLAPPVAALAAIAAHTVQMADETVMPYLTGEELRYLQIPSGTLDEQERMEIESHVDQTYQFLAQIPWSDDLKNVARYAGAHHEMLDGSGYPRRVKGAQIPIQARLITIADVFDALTEADRPYRSALPVDKALALLEADAKRGRLDPDLVQIMVDSQVYKRITEEDWHQL